MGDRLKRLSGALAVMAVLALMFAVQGTVAPDAGATHGRALQLTWDRTAPDTVQFGFTGSFRRSYFGSPNVGDSVYVGDLDFGDGSSPASVDMTVVQIDTTNDWIIGHATIPHTYAGGGPFTAEYTGCCRLSAPEHINNPDDNYTVQTMVDLSLPGSPESSIAPIVDCPPNALCSFTIPATDPAGGTVTYRLADLAESGIATQPPGASVNATTGVYSWNTTGATVNAPPTDTYYSTQVVIDHKDAAGTVQSSVAVDFFIRIATGSTNRPPVFEAPTPADGTTISGTVGSPMTFSVKASDPDSGDTVTPGTIGLPSGATFTPTPGNPATATFTWTPTAVGNSILNLTAQDQSGLGAVVRSITLDVTTGGPANTPPVAVDDSAMTTPGAAVSGNVLSNDTDADGDALTAVKVSDPANGTVTLGADGAFTYTPSSGFSGTDSFTYKANDGTADSNTATVTITVSAPYNTPPVAVDDSATTKEGAAVSGNVLSNDTDADGDALSAVKVSDPANGTVTLGADGAFTYTPKAGFSGTDSFTYKANDGNADSNTATVTVTVTPGGGGGPVCTITGTEHSDVLIGTPGDDVICGLGGSDFIDGLGGNDIILGGDGNDFIIGGSGNDTIQAGNGNDVAFGCSGNDTIDGGPGTDIVVGGSGHDQVTGGPGWDPIVMS